MGRKKNIDKVREIFKNNGYATVDEYFINGSKDPDFNLGKVWVDKDGNFLCADAEYNLKDWKFLLDYKITKLEFNIGFSEENQKWYGWSHRAIFGFGIGSTVKKGDIAYEPDSEEDFINDYVNFWINESDDHFTELVYIDKDCFNPEDDGNMEIVDSTSLENEEIQVKNIQTNFSSKGYKGCLVSLRTNFRGKQQGRESYITDYWAMYPDKWGKGEWTAKSIDDAKEIARAFAKNIS